jgi:hypothetical protein
MLGATGALGAGFCGEGMAAVRMGGVGMVASGNIHKIHFIYIL